MLRPIAAVALLLLAAAPARPDPLQLMELAADHARRHGAPVPIAAPDRRLVRAGALAARLHAAGHAVIPWTVNDPAEMRRLVQAGVEGVITDRPDLLAAVVREERAGARVAVVGHRGAAGLAPENTVAAIESGLEAGATWIEIDVSLTADGVAVLAHDPAISPAKCRRMDGRREPVVVADATASFLRRTFVCDRGATRPGAHHIPTLDEALTFVTAWEARSGRKVAVTLDLKSHGRRSHAAPLADAAAHAARDAGRADRTVLQAFDARILLAAQAAHPDLQTSWLLSDGNLPDALLVVRGALPPALARAR